MEHKKQHWVPSSYLEAWCDSETPEGQEPFVWIFPKDEGPGKRKAPKNIFYETDMYTIHGPDGARDLRLEEGLSGLETMFAKIRREKLEKRVELGPDDRLALCAFVAAAQVRTRHQRDHFKSQWSGVLEDMDAIREAMSKKTPKEREELGRLMGAMRPTGPSLGYEEVQKLANAPLQHMLDPAIATQVPVLFGMSLAVLCTDDPLGFITSDAPCVWFDPDAHNRPPMLQAPGLMWPSIEVTLPVSPNCHLLLNRAGREGYFMALPRVLDELNRRTRGYAGEYFVVRRNETKPIWYEWGVPPST